MSTSMYLREKGFEEFKKDKTLQSSLALKRLVKPVFRFARDIESPIWFYVGTRSDHLIMPRIFCSCKDFVINVMSRKSKHVCRHLIIQFIGEQKGFYRVVELPDVETFVKIVYEILDINISPTLRKLLYRRSQKR